MRLRHSSILIFTCFSCLGFYPNRASTATPTPAPQIVVGQASSKSPVVLKTGSKGLGVQSLQTQLKKLGYFNGVVNGRYRASTRIAVAKFQKAKALKRVDGIADVATQRSLQAAFAVKNQSVTSSIIPSPVVTSGVVAFSPTPQPTPKPQPTERGFIWWSLLGLGFLGSVGAVLYLIKRFGQVKQEQESQTLETETLGEVNKVPDTRQLSELDNTRNGHHNPTSVTSSQRFIPLPSAKLLPPATTSRLAKINIVDELIKDLHSNDSAKRRKAIWDLGQQGDSRAIQPLVELMVNADSQQTSLILAALAEIGGRTLKPMNRALAISMQDESPQVRQNAIRDLTRVYDMMNQMAQMLRHALEDPDAEVQATARYALTQMNRMRSLGEQQSLPEASHKDSQH
jgi:peptidoglycan hydrolase-like protein with peptidoglycan-binding domain